MGTFKISILVSLWRIMEFGDIRGITKVSLSFPKKKKEKKYIEQNTGGKIPIEMKETDTIISNNQLCFLKVSTSFPDLVCLPECLHSYFLEH